MVRPVIARMTCAASRNLAACASSTKSSACPWPSADCAHKRHSSSPGLEMQYAVGRGSQNSTRAITVMCATQTKKGAYNQSNIMAFRHKQNRMS